LADSRLKASEARVRLPNFRLIAPRSLSASQSSSDALGLYQEEKQLQRNGEPG